MPQNTLTPEHLQQVPLFQNLTPAEQQEVIHLSYPRRVEQDAYFFFQDDPARHFYLITQGWVKLSQVTQHGQQIILHTAFPWQIFGLVALLPDKTYPVSAQAAENCHTFAWEGASLQSLTQRNPALLANGMQTISDTMREVQNLYRELATERVERRLAHVLLRMAHQIGRKTENGILIDLAITRQEWAEMSGTTLYTVSRCFSKWETEHLIHAGRERVFILAPHRLVQIAEDLPPDK